MSRWRDPVQQRDDESMDLQDVVNWEPKSIVDRVIYRLYRLGRSASRSLLVIVALLIFSAQFALGGLGSLTEPVVGTFVLLSSLPALVLVGYIRYTDVTAPAPLRILVVTFILGVLFAGFAGVLNELLVRPTASVLSEVGVTQPVVLPLIFLFVVAPIEESVKMLAVRLYAFPKPTFDAVIAGAVYGGAAGLGFATIENAIYITQVADGGGSLTSALAQSGTITAQRALAGPGHVIYSAFAGYYLGLAKFNRKYAGPIVVKGLLVAILIHGGYNILVSHVPDYLTELLGFSDFAALFTFIIAYDGIFTAILVRKLSQYRAAYRQVHANAETTIQSKLTEFE